jgi:predicted lipoprotein with Yx(FWY)xxD motif
MPVLRRLGALVATILFVAACTTGGAGSSPSAGGPSAGASGAAAVTVGTATSASLGTFLTGPNGMALYTHAGDSATSSTCSGSCATAWPPLAASGQPMAGTGVTGQLGTLTRADGTMQVTYAGLPLYYWQGDTKAGDVTGNGVDGFSIALVSGAAPMPSTSGGSAPSASPNSRY